MTIRFYASTDVGRVRDHNEDNYLVDRQLQCYIVCDGMGGHKGGEVASATAVNVVREQLMEHRERLRAYQEGTEPVDRQAVLDLLDGAVSTANARIHDRASNNPEHEGMGTTLTLLLLLGRRGFVAHVGDSRLYRRRRELVEQLTEDHSLYNAMVQSGQAVDDDDERIEHLKNAVTRAVGVHEEVEVEVFDVGLEEGDRFLLCTDGLHGYLEEEDAERLMSVTGEEQAAEAMIQHANQRGGRDNITAVVIQVPGGDGFEESVGVAALDELLRRTPLGNGLTSREIHLLVRRLDELNLEPGELLFEEGDAPKGIYVVAEGEIRAVSSPGSERTLVAGDVLGETALLAGTVQRIRTSASEDGPAVLYLLSRDSLGLLHGEEPAMVARMVLALARRVAGRLVTAADVLRDPIWRYGAPAAGEATKSTSQGSEEPTNGTGEVQTDSHLPAGMPAIPADDEPGFDGQTDDTLPGDKSIDDILQGGSRPDPLQGLDGKDHLRFEQDG